MMSLEIEGIDELIGKLDNAIKENPKRRNKFLKQEAENLIRYTKDLTPVDTGVLKNNWHQTRPYAGVIKVYNNTEYAAHVEYGHRVKNRKGEWVKDAQGKIKFIPGEKMLHQGIDALRENFEDDAKLIMGDIFK